MAVKAGVVPAANQDLPRFGGARIAGVGQKRAAMKSNQTFVSATPSLTETTRQNTQAEVSRRIQSRLPLWDDGHLPV